MATEASPDPAPVQAEVLTDDKLVEMAEETVQPELGNEEEMVGGGNDIGHASKEDNRTEDAKSDGIDGPLTSAAITERTDLIQQDEEEEDEEDVDDDSHGDLDETLASEPLSDEVGSDVSSFISEDDPLGSLRRLLNQVLIHFTEDYHSRPASAGTSGGLGIGSPSGDFIAGKGQSLSRQSSGIIELCMRSVSSNTLAPSMQRRLAMKSSNQRRRQNNNNDDDLKDSTHLSDKIEAFGNEEAGTSPVNALAQSLVNFLLTTPEITHGNNAMDDADGCCDSDGNANSNNDGISQHLLVSPLVIQCISSLMLAAVHFANAQSALNAVNYSLLSSSSSSSSSAAVVSAGSSRMRTSSSVTGSSGDPLMMGSAAYPIISIPRMCAYMLDRVELTLRSLFNFKHYFALHLMTDAKRCRLFALQCALYRRFPLLTTEGCTSLARPPVFYGTKQCSLFASGTTASNERKRVAWELLQTDACFKTIPSRTTRSGDSRATGSSADPVKDSADGSAADSSKSSSSAMSGLIECMDLRSLEQSIERDQSRGKLPCVVVASLTDDLYKMRQICNRQGLWLHVEADGNALTRQALLLAASSSLPKSTQILMQCADSISTHPSQWFADSSASSSVFGASQIDGMPNADGIGGDVTLVFIREDMRDTPPPLIGFTALDFGLLFPLWFQLCLNSGPSFNPMTGSDIAGVSSSVGTAVTAAAAVAAGPSSGRSSASPPPTVSHASLVKARVDHSLALVAHLKSLVCSDKPRSLTEHSSLSPDSVFSGVSFGPESCAPHVLLFEILPLQSSVGFDLDLICGDSWRLDEYLLSTVMSYFTQNRTTLKGGFGSLVFKAIGLCGQQRGGSAAAQSYGRNAGGFEFTPLSLNTNDCLRIKNGDLDTMVSLICDCIAHIRRCVMMRGYLQSLLIRAEAKGEILWIDSSEMICTDLNGASQMFDLTDLISSLGQTDGSVVLKDQSFASLVTLGGFRYVPAYYSQFPKSPSVNLLNVALYQQLVSQCNNTGVGSGSSGSTETKNNNNNNDSSLFQLAVLSDGGGFVIVMNPSLQMTLMKDATKSELDSLKAMCEEIFYKHIVKALNTLVYPPMIMDEMSAALREAMNTAEKQLMDEQSQEYSADNMIRSIPLFGSMYGWLIPDDQHDAGAGATAAAAAAGASPTAAGSAGPTSSSAAAAMGAVSGSSRVSPVSGMVDEQLPPSQQSAGGVGKSRGRSFDMISRRLVATAAPRTMSAAAGIDESNRDYSSANEERPVGLTGALSGNHISEYESTPAQPL